MSELVLTTDNFASVIAGTDKPVLVDFWAEWCGPCRVMGPVLHAFAEENADKVLVGKVNVDQEPALAMQFQINAIPSLLVFRNGKKVATQVGLCDGARLAELAGLK